MSKPVDKRRRGLLMGALSSVMTPGGVLGAVVSATPSNPPQVLDPELIEGVIETFNAALGVVEEAVYESGTVHIYYDEFSAPSAFDLTCFRRVDGEDTPFREGVGFYFYAELNSVSDYQRALKQTFSLDLPFDYCWIPEDEVSEAVLYLTHSFASFAQQRLAGLLYIYQMSPSKLDDVLKNCSGSPENIGALKAITADTIVDFVVQVLDFCDLVRRGQHSMIDPVFNNGSPLANMIDCLAPNLPGGSFPIDKLKDDKDLIRMILEMSFRYAYLQGACVTIPESVAESYEPIKRVWALDNQAPDPFLLDQSVRQARMDDLMRKIDAMINAREEAEISEVLRGLDEFEREVQSAPSTNGSLHGLTGTPGIGSSVASLVGTADEMPHQVATEPFNVTASGQSPVALPAPTDPEIVIVPTGQGQGAEPIPVAKPALGG